MSGTTAPLINDDLLSPEALADPHSALSAVREHDPVHWNPLLRAWIITRHDDVAAGFRDQERLSSDRVTPVFEEKLSAQERTTRAPTFEILQHWLVFRDPPDHTRLRSLMRLAFTPRAVEVLRPRVDEIVGGLIESALERGEIDMVRDFAYPIPAIVIAEMLGAPPEDRDRFKAWSDDITVLVFGGENTPERKAQAQRGLLDLADYLQHLITRYRQEPGDNLLSALIAAQDADDRLTDDEILSNATLLIFGGHETTTNLISVGMLSLLRNPEQLELLRADPSLDESAVEELHRYDGPSKMMARRAAQTFELRGSTIEAGQQVLLAQIAANRDPRQFERPDELDLRRAQNRHHGFGFGIHYCLGASLARLEVTAALPRFVRSVRDVELLVDEPDWVPLVISRGLHGLPIRFRAA